MRPGIDLGRTATIVDPMDASFLQHRIAFRRIHGKNLFIVPDLPSWVVLTDEEAILFKYLVDGQSERDVVDKGIEAGISATIVDSVLVSLLAKLRDRHIFPAPENTWQAPDATNYGRNMHLCLTHRCNLHCRHCYLQAGVSKRTELDLVQWKQAFSRLMAIIARPDITISGGEPTVVPYLPELVKYLHEAGARLTLYTNGTRDVKELVPYLNGVQVSLEGFSAETHDYIRGKGVFCKVREFLESFRDKSKLSIALTLMYHNFDEVRQPFPPKTAQWPLFRQPTDRWKPQSFKISLICSFSYARAPTISAPTLHTSSDLEESRATVCHLGSVSWA